MEKTYQPQQLEANWYKTWEERGYFAPQGDGDPYCIVIPPPNVIGVLTMGHVLNNTLQDVLIRRARLEGRSAMWLPGTDHAGIATQMLVERQLNAEGKTIVMVTHDDDIAHRAQRVVCFRDGEIISNEWKGQPKP